MKTKINIFFILSFLSFILINLLPEKAIFCAISSVLILVVYLKNNLAEKLNFKNITKSKFSSHVFSCVIAVFLGSIFFDYWNDTAFIKTLSENKIINNSIVSVATVILSLGVYCLFIPLINYIKEKIAQAEFSKSSEALSSSLSATHVLVIFITSVVCITICSKSSPLYPFNDWYDANCFFTVGKSIANGKVLYKDIYEQKGPVLYFLHTVFYFISPTSFIGGYIAEIISCFSFLLISYKTLILFASQKIIVLIPLFAVTIYSSYSFSHGGSAEEFCLPLLALCFYYGLKSVARKEKITYFQWFIIGVTSALVLWTKYTFLGLYIGFGLYFLVSSVTYKEMKNFFSSMLYLILGIIVGSLPVIIYFVSNNAVSSLINVYFYDNIKLYSIKKSDNPIINLIINLFNATFRGAKYYSFCTTFIVFGAIYLFIRKSSVSKFYLTCLISSIFVLFMGGKCYIYYPFILSVFAPMGILLVYHIFAFLFKKVDFSKMKNGIKAAAITIYSLSFVAVIFFQSPNIYMLKHKKEELPQYVFCEIIKETPNATLLNYGFLDGGFYTVSNINPHLKYFCTLNIKKEEMKTEQQRYIIQGLTDFIVTNEELPEWAENAPYTVVSTSSFFFEGKTRTYYLYKKTQ